MKLIKLIAAVLLTAGAAAVQAAPIVTLSAPGETTTSVVGATTIDFNSGCGYASCTGDFLILSSSIDGQSAQPAGIDSPFLSVPNPNANGSATFTLGTTANYFGLFWGSVDSYNSISFLLGEAVVSTFSGIDIVGTQYANGDQGSLNSNVYVNFDFGVNLFDAVILSSNGFAFESDNHAYRSAAVPEPATALLMLVGLLGLMGARKRRA